MFLLSFKLTKIRMLIAGLAFILVVGLAVGGYRLSVGDSLAAGSGELGTDAKVTTKVKDNSERVAFVRSFGWEVDADPMEVMEVIIPQEFDEIYTGYNSMQMTQGFDLIKFAGKRVKRYTYNVTNYPGGEEVRVNLLVSGEKIIGGDVSSTKLDGFMHGFSMPE